MTNPLPQQLDMSKVAAELERDPLSKALFENAQLKVLVRELLDRIGELERQQGADSAD